VWWVLRRWGGGEGRVRSRADFSGSAGRLVIIEVVERVSEDVGWSGNLGWGGGIGHRTPAENVQ